MVDLIGNTGNTTGKNNKEGSSMAAVTAIRRA